MIDRFLCTDAECWIDPVAVAEGRRQRNPGLSLPSVVLYTPLDFGESGSNWVVDAIGLPSRSLGEVGIKSVGATVALASGRELGVVIGPIGAPATAMVLEGAIALGARTILFFGICGSLQPALGIGDLILVEEALREEGTSFHYLPSGQPAVASPALLERAARTLSTADVPYARGRIWTTDAPYRETRTKVRRLAAEGVLGVEMETSAVYALATHRGVEALSVQVVSDQLIGEKWTGITRASFRDRCDRALRLLATIADGLDAAEPS